MPDHAQPFKFVRFMDIPARTETPWRERVASLLEAAARFLREKDYDDDTARDLAEMRVADAVALFAPPGHGATRFTLDGDLEAIDGLTITSAEPPPTEAEWEREIAAWGRRCAHCGGAFRQDEIISKDHLVPRSKGGLDCLRNLVPCCLSCNSTRRDQPIEKFYAKRGYDLARLSRKLKAPR